MAPEDRKTQQFNTRVRASVAAEMEERMRAEGISKRSDLLLACMAIALTTTPAGQLLARAAEIVERDRRMHG